jgi:hypothetical protein
MVCRLAAGGTGSEPSVPPDRSSGGTSPADNRSDPPTLSSSGARDGFVPLELSYFRPVRPERPASTCGTRSSNPLSSSGESGTNRAAARQLPCRRVDGRNSKSGRDVGPRLGPTLSLLRRMGVGGRALAVGNTGRGGVAGGPSVNPATLHASVNAHRSRWASARRCLKPGWLEVEGFATQAPVWAAPGAGA